MIQWDQSGFKGVMGRLEIIIHKRKGLWAYTLWTNKSILTQREGLSTKEAAQVHVQSIADRMARDADALEKVLYGTDPDDDEGM